MGTSQGDISRSGSISHVTEGGTRIKEETKPGHAERDEWTPSEGANHRERAGGKAIETEGRWLGVRSGSEYTVNGGPVGTQCPHSKREGCLSEVEYGCRLALFSAMLGLSFNLFFHHHGSTSSIPYKHSFIESILNTLPAPYQVQLTCCCPLTG